MAIALYARPHALPNTASAISVGDVKMRSTYPNDLIKADEVVLSSAKSSLIAEALVEPDGEYTRSAAKSQYASLKDDGFSSTYSAASTRISTCTGSDEPYIRVQFEPQLDRLKASPAQFPQKVRSIMMLLLPNTLPMSQLVSGK